MVCSITVLTAWVGWLADTTGIMTIEDWELQDLVQESVQREEQLQQLAQRHSLEWNPQRGEVTL